MSRLVSSILKRDQIVERLTAHPLSLALGAVIVFAQVAILVGEISGIPFGTWFSLDLNHFQVGGLLFPFSHYAPIAPDVTTGAGFSGLDFLASLTLFFVCGMSLLTCGPVVESYYGTRRTFLALVLCTVGHAAVASALPGKFAFSTLAFATFLIVTSLLVQLERRETRVETENDLRMLLLMAAVVLAAMTAGFLQHSSYDSLLAGVGVGPAFAVVGFVVNWKLQMREVRMRGEGKVGNLYFVEEIDLLTREEIEERMDRLLDKIANKGMDSLEPEENRFLKNASQRLKASESEEASI
ncbi:MAG: hypothetical protein KDB68_14600 [Planctomycetes bacterium]|nr:hypothetical protein [Planctomycetota bacterium]